MTKGGDGKLKIFKLGDELGSGVTSEVFQLKNGADFRCSNPCVAKLLRQDAGWFGSNSNIVKNIVKGSALARDAGVEQLAIISADPNAATPFIIQEELRSDMGVFSVSGSGDSATFYWKFGGQKKQISNIYGFLQADEKMQRAYFETISKLAKATPEGIGWEDGHLLNVYFRKTSDGWVCGPR